MARRFFQSGRVLRDGVSIAQHERSYGRGEQVLDPRDENTIAIFP